MEVNKKGLWTSAEVRKNTLMLICGTTILYLIRTLPSICAVNASHEYGWDKSQTGLYLSTFFWGYLSTQMIGGWLADRFGPERVLHFSTIGYLAATVVAPLFVPSGFSTSLLGVSPLFALVLLRVVTGLTQGVFYPSLSSLTSRRVRDADRGTVFSIIGSGNHVGTILSGAVGSLLLENSGWRGVYYASVAIGVVWLLVFSWFFVFKKQTTHNSVSDEDKALVNAPTREEFGMKLVLKLTKSRAFWAMIQCHFCQSYMFYILYSWIPTYFHENFPQAKSWMFTIVPYAVNIPASVLSGVFADLMIRRGLSKTRTRKVIQVCVLLGGSLCMLLLPYVESYEFSLLLITVAMGCSSFNSGGVVVAPADLAPGHAGVVFGMMNTAGAIPGFLGVYLAGRILSVTHSWAAVFRLPAVLEIISLLIFLKFFSSKQVI